MATDIGRINPPGRCPAAACSAATSNLIVDEAQMICHTGMRSLPRELAGSVTREHVR
jgi:hypothetical protein